MQEILQNEFTKRVYSFIKQNETKRNEKFVYGCKLNEFFVFDLRTKRMKKICTKPNSGNTSRFPPPRASCYTDDDGIGGVLSALEVMITSVMFLVFWGLQM